MPQVVDAAIGMAKPATVYPRLLQKRLKRLFNFHNPALRIAL